MLRGDTFLLKVLHAIDYYPFYVGKVVHEIAKNMSSNAVEVKVVSSNIGPHSRNNDGCANVVRLQAKRIVIKGTPYVIYGLASLKRFRKQLDVDVIHTHFLHDFLTLYLGFMKKLGELRPPLVATSHGLVTGYQSTIVKATAKLLHEVAKKLVVENSTAITTVSMVEYSFLADFVPRNRLFYIPNGVDTSLFRPDAGKRHRLRGELGVDDNDILVLYFAHLRAVKGVFVFLKAMDDVVRRTRSIHFMVAGSGPLANHLERAKDSFGDRVHTHLTYIPEKDLPDYFNASDIYVLPSYVEGMPLSVMEAMACGKPVIVTNVGDMPILARDNVNGLVIPSGNASSLSNNIIYLAENHKLRDAMGEANARKMIGYDWKEIAKKYKLLYQDLLNARDGCRM